MTRYKRTLVEEYAPYVQLDGLVVRIKRHEDLECNDAPITIEERFENRCDLMWKTVKDCETSIIVEHFYRGREDAVKS